MPNPTGNYTNHGFRTEVAIPRTCTYQREEIFESSLPTEFSKFFSGSFSSVNEFCNIPDMHKEKTWKDQVFNFKYNLFILLNSNFIVMMLNTKRTSRWDIAWKFNSTFEGFLLSLVGP